MLQPIISLPGTLLPEYDHHAWQQRSSTGLHTMSCHCFLEPRSGGKFPAKDWMEMTLHIFHHFPLESCAESMPQELECEVSFLRPRRFPSAFVWYWIGNSCVRFHQISLISTITIQFHRIRCCNSHRSKVGVGDTEGHPTPFTLCTRSFLAQVLTAWRLQSWGAVAR